MTQVIDIMKPTITGITLQEWVKTLPQNEQDDFAAAEIRRVALVNAAVAAGLLTVDADDEAAKAELESAVNAVIALHPDVPTGTGQLREIIQLDPAVIAANAKIIVARKTPTYTWTSEDARASTVITDPIWLKFWDRWAAENVV